MARSERDQVLSRLLDAVASHPSLGDELALRGGAALHDVRLPEPARSCAGLQYARVSRSPIGPVLDGLREVAAEEGLRVNTDVREVPRVRMRGLDSFGRRLNIRVDIDTRETVPFRPRTRVRRTDGSGRGAPAVGVLTFCDAELAAVTLRTLMSRKSGRDLFDLWLFDFELGVDPPGVVAAARHYLPASITRGRVRAVLEQRWGNHRVRSEFDSLIAGAEAEGRLGRPTFDEAAEWVDGTIVPLFPGRAPAGAAGR